MQQHGGRISIFLTTCGRATEGEEGSNEEDGNLFRRLLPVVDGKMGQRLWVPFRGEEQNKDFLSLCFRYDLICSWRRQA